MMDSKSSGSLIKTGFHCLLVTPFKPRYGESSASNYIIHLHPPHSNQPTTLILVFLASFPVAPVSASFHQQNRFPFSECVQTIFIIICSSVHFPNLLNPFVGHRVVAARATVGTLCAGHHMSYSSDVLIADSIHTY